MADKIHKAWNGIGVTKYGLTCLTAEEREKGNNAFHCSKLEEMFSCLEAGHSLIEKSCGVDFLSGDRSNLLYHINAIDKEIKSNKIHCLHDMEEDFDIEKLKEHVDVKMGLPVPGRFVHRYVHMS